jgi:hypothetical protein
MASFAAFKSWLRIDRQFIFLKLAYFLVYSGNLITSNFTSLTGTLMFLIDSLVFRLAVRQHHFD